VRAIGSDSEEACRRIGASALATPKEYETRPQRYAKRWGRDLAQGGGFAKPWVNVIHVDSPGKGDRTGVTLVRSQSDSEPAR
jgi:hypothetical protein